MLTLQLITTLIFVLDNNECVELKKFGIYWFYFFLLRVQYPKELIINMHPITPTSKSTMNKIIDKEINMEIIPLMKKLYPLFSKSSYAKSVVALDDVAKLSPAKMNVIMEKANGSAIKTI